MKRWVTLLLLSLVAFPLLSLGSGLESDPKTHRVRNRRGQVIQSFDRTGHAVPLRRPDGSWVAGAMNSPDLDSAPPDETRRAGRPAGDASGLGEENIVLPDMAEGILADSLEAASATIDSMTVRAGYYSSTSQPPGSLIVLGTADTYFLSNGTSWQSGAGYAQLFTASLDHVEVSGSTVRYVLAAPTGAKIYEQTDFDGGEHSAQGTLAAAGVLVLEATLGSNTAVLRGQAVIVANDATYYEEPRFNYYSSIVGSVVPFELTYTLFVGTWTPTIFETSFTYSGTGRVDFAHPVSVPALSSLEIRGSSQVPANSAAQFGAVAHYVNGVMKNVTDLTTWSVEPDTLASVNHGLITTGSLAEGRATLTLKAAYVEGGAQLEAQKTVIMIAAGSADLPGSWPMFQADSRHTGYVPVSLNPETFSAKWQRTIAPGRSLNPVAAADGKVFVSTLTYFAPGASFFALDARDGATLWSKDFGSVFSVNPPSYAYGNVYIQTGNHAGDTYLWAFESGSGALVFQSPHLAQWERYYAPTLYEGKVYVDGGSYGGMYAFDAFSGEKKWFQPLPQYDQWTPAVEGDYAYAYVGEYDPGLYVFNRNTGSGLFMIPDPHFDWNGWSMDEAPVLGGAGDVLVIHDGRLLSFDLSTRTIRWERERAFTGQLSVAHGVIYAIDNGKLAAVDQATGADRWSWLPPEGRLDGTLIVTDTHVLASTGVATYAVEILSHSQVWSYPAAGSLALGEDTLYVASNSGTLTAISLPEFIPSPAVQLEILGPTQVTENSETPYRSQVHYEDGRIRDRTGQTQWSVAPATFADIDAGGVMTTQELLSPSLSVVIHAAYTERDVTVSTDLTVNLVIGVSLDEFVIRNLESAHAASVQILELLGEVLLHEQAAQAVLLAERGENLETPAANRAQALARLIQAMQSRRVAEDSMIRSAGDLEAALNNLIGVRRPGIAPSYEQPIP